MDNVSVELAGTASRRRLDRGVLLAAWVFPVLCWAAATLFLGGNLGKSTDDYSINLRDPVTNAIPHPFNPFKPHPYFWRPLHNLMCYSVGTFWPSADRSIHVATALCHGAACLLLFLVLRTLTRTRLAPALAALVFMSLPFQGEVAFWFCTTSTAIGTSLVLAAALVAIRFARVGGRPIIPLGSVFLLTLGAACFYEQAAAASAALPVLCLAGAPLVPWKRSFGRAASVTIPAGSACLLYAFAMIATVPAQLRGGANSIVAASELAERTRDFAGMIESNLVGERARDIVLGSLELGWSAVRSPRGLLVGSVLGAAALLWLLWAVRPGSERSEQAPMARGGEPASRPTFLFLAGAVLFAAAWVPLFVVARQRIEIRTMYVPLVGLATCLAACLDVLLSSVQRFSGSLGGAARWACAVLGLAAVASGAVGLIGFQALFQARSLMDQREIAALRRIVPDPPPGAVFVPFQDTDAPVTTGHPLLDNARIGVFETPWSARAAIQFAYRRSDIVATSTSRWLPGALAMLNKPGPDGVRWTEGLDPAHTRRYAHDPDGGLRIPWTEMIPLAIDAGGHVRLIRRLDVERTDHRDFQVDAPIVKAAIDAAKAEGKRVPAIDFAYFEPPPEGTRPDLIPLKFWHLADGSAAKFEKMWIWCEPSGASPGGPAREAIWLAAGFGERARMSIPLPPSDREEQLLLRATIAEYDVDPGRNPFARVEELVVTMAGAPDRPLAVLRLDPAEVRAQRRWYSLVVTLPPRTAAAGDRLVLTPRLVGEEVVQLDPSCQLVRPTDNAIPILPIWITRGYEQSKPSKPSP